MTPITILVGLSIILSVVSMIWNTYPILPVATLLLGIAFLVGSR